MSRDLLQIVLRHTDGLTVDDAPDALLLRRFASTRDESAFAALVKRHAPMVWAVCRQSIPNRADAEDAFQATFLALSQSAKKVRTPEHLGGWLHAAAVRICGRAKRTFARRQTRERATARPEADSPVSAAAWNDLLAAVHAEVSTLSPSLRAVFVLCDLEGVDQADAARQLGLKGSTLTGQLARARQRLMAALSRRGVAAGAVAVGTAVAVPEAVAQKAAGGAVPSAAVVELAREVTTMTLGKLKLLAAGLVVAGGLTFAGFGLISNAAGQYVPPGFGGPPTGKLPDPPRNPGGPPPTSKVKDGPPVTDKAPPSGLPPGAGGPPPGVLPGGEGPGPGTPGTGTASVTGATVEYLFVAKPGTLAEVAKVLRTKANRGWEYTGPLDVDPAEPPPGGGAEGVTKDTRVVLVFKRYLGPAAPPGGMNTGGGWGGGPPGGVGPDTVPAPGGKPGSGPPTGGGTIRLPKPDGGGNNPFGGGDGQPEKEKPKAVVYPLKDADAGTLAETLGKLLTGTNGVVVVAEPVSNSLLVSGPKDVQAAVADLLRALDVPAKEKPKPPAK